jgi:hypothetical protein
VDENHPVTKTAEGERETARFVALFLFGVILFSPPVIAIFDVPGASVFGIPLLYAYLFASWAVLIALAAWLARQIMTAPPPRPRSSSASDG